MEESQNPLEAHEQRLIERNNAEKGVDQGTNQALQARNDQKFKGRGVGRGRGRLRGGQIEGRNANSSEQSTEDNGNEQRKGSKRGGRQSRGRGRKNYDKRNIQCYTWNKFWHYSAECWHNEAVKKSMKDEAANLAQDTCDSESDHVLLMSTMEHVDEDLRWRLMQDKCEKEPNHALDKCDQGLNHVLNRCNHGVDHVLM